MTGAPHPRISCTRRQATAACAAFIEESRMKFVKAYKLHRKSGGVGHPSFVHPLFSILLLGRSAQRHHIHPDLQAMFCAPE